MSDSKNSKGKVPQDHSPARRNFLRTAAAMTGGVAIAARGAEPAPMAGMDHAAMGHDMSDYGSMMFMKGHHMDGVVTEPPGAPADTEVEYKVFDIEVSIVQHEILPGIKVHMFAFNKQVPGPEFHVYEGDWVKVNFINKTEEMHTIHWHGLYVPYTMDGVPMMTQDPVHPGQTFVYRFQAKPAGTHWYHCHWSTPLHASHAMHGAFIIHRKDEPLKKIYPYTRDYTLVLEAWDIDLAREEFNSLLEGMKQVNALMEQGRLDPVTHGFFRNYTEFVRAVEGGKYVPPYVQGRSSGVEFRYNFFGINGKSHPAGKHFGIKQGEWIRIRFVNASDVSHHMHLHGHDFYFVAQDGNDLPQPLKLNTLHVHPGGTYDIMVYGDNPGIWALHNHRTTYARNNGIYPGGMHTAMVYEDFTPTYTASLATDE